MDTQVVTETEGDERGRTSLIRVAVAGASGFAGQELIRLLARHPNVTITAATGSQATSTPRRLPSLSKIWDGTVVPLNAAAFAADAVFLALPEAASAELAPTLVASGLRVIDLSGAFRLRDDATRDEVLSGDGVAAEGRRLRADRIRARGDHVGAPAVEPGLLSDRIVARPPAAAARRVARRRAPTL